MPTVTVPLLSVASITPRSRLVTLDLRNHPFRFRPGHAVLIGEPGRERRPYSIANSPTQAAETQTLELLIALEADGTLGPHLTGIATGGNIDLARFAQLRVAAIARVSGSVTDITAGIVEPGTGDSRMRRTRTQAGPK